MAFIRNKHLLLNRWTAVSTCFNLIFNRNKTFRRLMPVFPYPNANIYRRNPIEKPRENTSYMQAVKAKANLDWYANQRTNSAPKTLAQLWSDGQDEVSDDDDYYDEWEMRNRMKKAAAKKWGSSDKLSSPSASCQGSRITRPKSAIAPPTFNWPTVKASGDNSSRSGIDYIGNMQASWETMKQLSKRKSQRDLHQRNQQQRQKQEQLDAKANRQRQYQEDMAKIPQQHYERRQETPQMPPDGYREHSHKRTLPTLKEQMQMQAMMQHRKAQSDEGANGKKKQNAKNIERIVRLMELQHRLEEMGPIPYNPDAVNTLQQEYTNFMTKCKDRQLGKSSSSNSATARADSACSIPTLIRRRQPSRTSSRDDLPGCSKNSSTSGSDRSARDKRDKLIKKESTSKLGARTPASESGIYALCKGLYDWSMQRTKY